MISNKTLLTFFGVALSMYLLLVLVIVPSLQLDYGTSNFTANAAKKCFPKTEWIANPDKAGKGKDIDIKIIAEAKDSRDGQIKRSQGVNTLSSKNKVLIPFLILLSFITATFVAFPMSWRNRIIVTLLALIIFSLYCVFLFSMSINYVERVTVAHIQNGEQKAKDIIEKLWFGQFFNTNIGFMTIIPTIMWALITAWAVDWKKVLTRKA